MAQPVLHVNKHDRVVGTGTIEEAIQHNLALRVVRVLITNNKQELLLQQRSAKIAASALKWDQSAGGHVDAGETYLQAAHRELKEEMGVSLSRLKRITKFYTEDPYKSTIRKRFNVLYVAQYDDTVTIDPDEVANYTWVSFHELRDWIQQKPEEFTRGCLVALKLYEQHLLGLA